MKCRQHSIISRCVEDTVDFGAFLGGQLAKGSVITLSGELGSGKTCLAQGIARGLEVPEGLYVTSPSYTLINEYPGRLHLFHIDLYRVGDISELEEIGLDEILAADGVIVVEWGEKLPGILPEQRLRVSISTVNDETRKLDLMGYGNSAGNLVEKCLKYEGK